MKNILSLLKLGKDKIWSYQFQNIEQATEIQFRKKLGTLPMSTYLEASSQSHSTAVMDKEIIRFQ